MNRKPETAEQRAHRHDREVASATYKAERAREGRGYVFRSPERARR